MIVLIIRFLKLLNLKEKILFYKIIFFTIIAAFLESLSVGALFPIISTFINSEDSIISTYFESLELNSFSNLNILLFGLIIIFILYFLKALFITYVYWIQLKFLYNNQSQVASHLLKNYLNNNYDFYLKNNSSKLIKNIVSETHNYLTYFLQSLVNLMTEIFVTTFIFFLLILINPISALLISSIFIMLYWMFNLYFGKKVELWGIDRENFESNRMKLLQEAFGSIKEILVFGRARFFLTTFIFLNNKITFIARKQTFIMQLPRIWLETFMVFGLSILSYFLINSGNTIESVIAILVVYGAAAFRLLPSVSRIIGSVQSIKFAVSSLNIIENDFNSKFDILVKHNTPKSIAFKNKINFNNVTFSYSRNGKNVLNNVSFEINKGEIVGIIGESASGKSTLIDLLLGLLTPISGSVKVDGKFIKDDLRSWQNLIGYVPQNVVLTDSTIFSNVAFGCDTDEINNNNVIKALEQANLGMLLNDDKQILDQKIGEKGILLSGGQKQRLGIARALYNDPEILIFDEATSALDSVTENEFLETVYSMKGIKTIFIISHKIDTLYRCEKILCIENGKVIIK